jgi:hypothetical protein
LRCAAQADRRHDRARPLEGNWAPGYYYVLFEDPDGIRIEVNHVPGAGVLAEGAAFNPSQGYV